MKRAELAHASRKFLNKVKNTAFENELEVNEDKHDDQNIHSLSISPNDVLKNECGDSYCPLIKGEDYMKVSTNLLVNNSKEENKEKSNKLSDNNLTENDLFSKKIKKDKCKADLSKRFDVVIKTLVRSIKRYYSAEVGINSAKRFSINSLKVIERCQKIDEICESKFANNFAPEIIANSYSLHELLTSKCKYLCQLKEESTQLPDIVNLSCKPKVLPNSVNSVFANSLDEIKFDVQLYHEIKILLACMTDRVCMSKLFQIKSIKTISQMFYDTIYKYSHKKMKKLIKLGCFRILFLDFIKNGTLDIMISNDKTLSKNSENFKESAGILLKLSH